jgi:hypothetical protein
MEVTRLCGPVHEWRWFSRCIAHEGRGIVVVNIPLLGHYFAAPGLWLLEWGGERRLVFSWSRPASFECPGEPYRIRGFSTNIRGNPIH